MIVVNNCDELKWYLHDVIYTFIAIIVHFILIIRILKAVLCILLLHFILYFHYKFKLKIIIFISS